MASFSHNLLESIKDLKNKHNVELNGIHFHLPSCTLLQLDYLLKAVPGNLKVYAEWLSKQTEGVDTCSETCSEMMFLLRTARELLPIKFRGTSGTFLIQVDGSLVPVSRESVDGNARSNTQLQNGDSQAADLVRILTPSQAVNARPVTPPPNPNSIQTMHEGVHWRRPSAASLIEDPRALAEELSDVHYGQSYDNSYSTCSSSAADSNEEFYEDEPVEGNALPSPSRIRGPSFPWTVRGRAPSVATTLLDDNHKAETNEENNNTLAHFKEAPTYGNATTTSAIVEKLNSVDLSSVPNWTLGDEVPAIKPLTYEQALEEELKKSGYREYYREVRCRVPGCGSMIHSRVVWRRNHVEQVHPEWFEEKKKEVRDAISADVEDNTPSISLHDTLSLDTYEQSSNHAQWGCTSAVHGNPSWDTNSGAFSKDQEEEESNVKDSKEGVQEDTYDDEFVLVSSSDDELQLIDPNERAMLRSWNGRARRGSVYRKPKD